MNRQDYQRMSIIIFLAVSLAVTFSCQDYDIYGLSAGSPWWSRLTYHFCHSGILHWLINAVVLLSIAFRLYLPVWQWILTLAIAVAYPQQEATPIIGASVWIYAIIGLVTPIVRHPWTFFLENVAIILAGSLLACLSEIFHFASVAWLAHLYAYAAGLLLGLFTQPLITIRR